MKEKIIIYGASKGGENYYNNQNEYIVEGFSDTYKTGEFKNLKIIPPTNLSMYMDKNEVDKIVIASIFYPEIISSLQNLGIPQGKIDLAPIQLLYDEPYPFTDEKTYEFAKRVFVQIVTHLNKTGIDYRVEFGTALGLVRDGELIPWDDDLDFSFYKEDDNRFEKALKELSALMEEEENIEWKVVAKYDENKRLLYYSLKFIDIEERYKTFSIDFTALYKEGKRVLQLYDYYPAENYEKREYVVYNDIKVPVPTLIENYLTYVYGDWKTPLQHQKYTDYAYDLNKDYDKYSNQQIKEI